jgi:hypothetical protein
MFDLRMVIPIFGILLVMIPVTGLTVGLLARTLAKVRREGEAPAVIEELERQIARLQEEVESLSTEVKELKVAQDFDRKLLAKESAS